MRMDKLARWPLALLLLLALALSGGWALAKGGKGKGKGKGGGDEAGKVEKKGDKGKGLGGGKGPGGGKDPSECGPGTPRSHGPAAPLFRVQAFENRPAQVRFLEVGRKQTLHIEIFIPAFLQQSGACPTRPQVGLGFTTWTGSQLPVEVQLQTFSIAASHRFLPNSHTAASFLSCPVKSGWPRCSY